MKERESQELFRIAVYFIISIFTILMAINLQNKLRVSTVHSRLIRIDMNNKFIPLDCDDDVVMFEKDTFKVSRIKELAKAEIRKKCAQIIYGRGYKNYDITVYTGINQISLGGERINISEIQYNLIKDCQILKIGGKGWQKGKLKIQIYESPNGNPPEVCLEFCSDEPAEPESPLDDIRQRMILAEK